MEHVRVSDRMRHIADWVIKENYSELGWIKEQGIKIQYLTSDSEKKSKGVKVFGECRKANATVRELGDCDYTITIYTNNTCNFTENQYYILIHHELLHIQVNDGKLCIRNHNVIMGEFSEIINRYGKYLSEPGVTEQTEKAADGESEVKP